MKRVAHRNCDSCKTAGATERERDGVTVWLHDDCFADRFRRERVFAESAGVPYAPETAAWGQPK